VVMRYSSTTLHINTGKRLDAFGSAGFFDFGKSRLTASHYGSGRAAHFKPSARYKSPTIRL
jgi:hypothetical protein